MLFLKHSISCSLLFIVLILNGVPSINSTPYAMYDIFGTDFSNDFGLIIDLNYDNRSTMNKLSPTLQVLQDLGNVANPKIKSLDNNPLNDQEYFFSHFKVEGIDNIFFALNKLEFNPTIEINNQTYDLGHINGTAPFQTLYQYFNYDFNNIIVANTFRGLLGYTTTDTNRILDPSDKIYLGHSFIDPHLINFLNEKLSNHDYLSIPQYEYQPIYLPSNHTFGMIYRNYFVGWQKNNSSAPNAISSVAGSSFNNVVTGEHLVGASLFDYLVFTYQVVDDPNLSNETVKTVNVLTHYEVGPMKWLIMNDNETTYNEIKSHVSAINGSNSFHTLSVNYEYPVSSSNTHSQILFNESIPELTFYTDSAINKRLDPVSMTSSGILGLGLAVVTSTNTFVTGQIVNTQFPLPNNNEISIPLFFGSKTFYKTEFIEQSTNTGTSPFILAQSFSNIDDILNNPGLLYNFFSVQSTQTYSLAEYLFRQLIPSELATSTIQDLHLTVDQTNYVTFIQFPEWDGYQIQQDSKFSAITIIQAMPTQYEPATYTDFTNPPGFEASSAILAIIPLYLIKRKIQ